MLNSYYPGVFISELPKKKLIIGKTKCGFSPFYNKVTK